MLSDKTGFQLPRLESSRAHYIPTTAFGLGRMDKCMTPHHLCMTYKYISALCLTCWQLPPSEHDQIVVSQLRRWGALKMHQLPVKWKLTWQNIPLRRCCLSFAMPSCSFFLSPEASDPISWAKCQINCTCGWPLSKKYISVKGIKWESLFLSNQVWCMLPMQN